MYKKFIILNLIFQLFVSGNLHPQEKPVFSGDRAKFSQELQIYMGTNLSEQNTIILNSFITKWDSSGFSRENMTRIVDISSQLTARPIRIVPQFIQFLQTLNDLVDFKKGDTFLSSWLKGFTDLLFNPRLNNANITSYMQNTSLLIRENLLINTGSVKWKIKNPDVKFLYDTIFKVILKNVTLTCYSLHDSTEIYNVSGTFFPGLQQFTGKKGVVTWEKAGFPSEEVSAEMTDYSINIIRSGFSCDSARLKHKTYFKNPVYGVLTDQAVTISSKEKATYPRFETYNREFRIKDIYKGIDYEGGLAFEGANVKGKGENFVPAKIKIFRKNTLFLKISSTDFLFSPNGLNSQETSVTIYLDKDSVFHSNLGFSFNAKSRQVNLFRTNNPVSPSPYYNTYHNIDMYFENLTWDMNSSKIIISKAKGAAMGQALFESSSFFDAGEFMKLMGLDEYHPLNRLIKFSEWYYSETFPVSEFAKWLNKPEEVVTGLCIDLANKGFIFYDRANNEVTIKKKTKDYIDSYGRKKDYDVLSIYSETKSPVDNAVLDLENFGMTVNGVSNIFLSDSQKVAIYPYNQQITLEKNRRFKFNGIVKAGLFTFFGKDFQFSYDTFKIKLQRIDSIKVEVETEEKDIYGNPVIKQISSIIQLATGELYIDDPDNKSGLKSLTNYPIINANLLSYIFYDNIPGLENIYKKEDFYFRIDPFIFENIDHYTDKDLNLSGEFFGGKILKPMKQYLTIQENNSLGFQMNIPDEGIELYDGKGRLFDQINMSNKGLIGGGTLKRLTSVTQSEEFKFFPDSMLTTASIFEITKDTLGKYPILTSQDVTVKWLPAKDEWIARNQPGKNFNMFANGTILDGKITLKPGLLSGTGIINMPESRITSSLFTFTSGAIKADTADYNLKSPSTSGYAFIAENARTDINFDSKLTRFHLNTDSSVVIFPEIQYICTMTDFEYDMRSRILSMENKGKTNTGFISPDKLLQVNFKALEKPTFIATNSLNDTIAFRSLKANYSVDNEFIEAENISYLHIADALIQPDSGRIRIERRAKIGKLNNAFIAVNNAHLLHSANIVIESSKRYYGSAVYDYTDDNNSVSQINFEEITVDTMTTSARGFISADQKFMLNPAFTFAGDVNLYAREKNLLFTGSVGIQHDCSSVESYPVKFKSYVDPKNVMIKLSDKPRDINDNILYSGVYMNNQSFQMYPAFLSPLKSWTDEGLVSADGVLWFNRAKGRYQISSPEKIADPSLNGDMVTLDKNLCVLSGEGKLNFGTNFDLLKMSGAGNLNQAADSGNVELKAILGLNFFFSPEALRIMSDEIRMMPTLKPVNGNSDFNTKGMKDLMGNEAAGKLKQESDLFGISGNIPKEFNYELLLNDVTLYWNEASSSFRSKGRIGIGFIGNQPINVYVDGFVDIQRRRSGDMIDIYLKADGSTWYYFSYVKGVLMAQSGNNSFNALLTSLKEKERKDPRSSVKVQYSYMIAVEDRLNRFLRRMAGEDQEPGILDGLVR